MPPIDAPRKLSKGDKQALRDLGFGKTKPHKVKPDWKPKKVVAAQCAGCDQRFKNDQGVCHRCGCCVFCGSLNSDEMGNYCVTCGNNGGPRVDAGIPTFRVAMKS